MPPRIRIEGHIYYITCVIQNRLLIFVRPSFIIPLIDSLNFYRYQHSFRLLGYVIMPDHMHLLIRPYGKSSVSDIMRDFKRFTSGRITRQARLECRTDWLQAFEFAGDQSERADFKVWQDGSWEQLVFTEKFMREKLNHIHLNPVRAGLVHTAEEYPYSSYCNYEMADESLIEMDRDWS
jgi:putative transposase